MNTKSPILTSLNSKVEKLILLHRTSEDEKLRLSSEKEDLLKLIKEQNIKNKQLEEENKAIRMAKDIKKDNTKSLDLKLKINELVREIDKCVAILNR